MSFTNDGLPEKLSTKVILYRAQGNRGGPRKGVTRAYTGRCFRDCDRQFPSKLSGIAWRRYELHPIWASWNMGCASTRNPAIFASWSPRTEARLFGGRQGFSRLLLVRRRS